MLRDRDTPGAVVINEALELARTFSTEESVKFINGMLDAIRKKIDALKALPRRSREQTENTNPFLEKPWPRFFSVSSVVELVYVFTRRANTATPIEPRGAREARGGDLSRAGSIGATRSLSWSDEYGERTHDELEADRIETKTSGRILAIRSFGKANFLVLSDGHRQDPGVHPAGRAAAARFPDLQAARFRRLGRRRRPSVPDARPTSSRSGPRGCTSSRSVCCRCRRSGTG